MRVKRSVDFQMAPKKSSKGKGVAAKPTREEGWVASKCSESDLDILVSSGLLLEKSVIQWRPTLGEDRPYEKYGRNHHFCSLFGTGIGAALFVFLPYLERGLGLPCLFFFSGLLRYYTI
jgi:hypothetical protein